MKLPDDWNWDRPNYEHVYEERVRRIEYMRKHPEIVPRLKDYYATHWADFCDDFFVTFDPRLAEKGMRTVVPFILFPKQREFLEWTRDRWLQRQDGVVEKSRDMGVSWLTCALAVCMFLFIPGTVVGFGSRKELYVDGGSNPASLFWKVRQLIDLLPKEFQPEGWDSQRHAPFMRIQNPENGSMIVGEAGDNVGRGNRTSLYVIDEAAFFERPEAVDAALSQTSNCRIYVSTPNGAGNPFYRKAHDGKTPKFVFDWRDDPRKDDAWYDMQKAKLDPVVVAQEIDRSYTASVSNAYIPGEVVSAASRKGPADIMAQGPVIMGIDVARFGNDKTCFTFRQGRVLMRQVVVGKLDTVDVYGRAKDEIRAQLGDVAQIAVDSIGIGAGVADMLRRDFGDIVVDVNSSLRMDDGENYNLRARMWRDMREWIKAGASIPNDNDLITDLTALQYSYRGGVLLIESKDDAKKRGIKSPDRADSLALTFAYPVKRETSEWNVPVGESMVWQAFDEITAY
jgi:hypothetical protein